jgi:SRSO17 transposase
MTVDDDLAAWITGLDDLFALVAGRFFRIEPRLRARAYVRGLLAPLASKNGWTLAEAAGDATPDGMQRLLNRAAWDADGVRDDVRAYVAGHLGSADGVLVVDETGFLKKGARSAGCSGSTPARPGGWRTASWACSAAMSPGGAAR